MNYRHSYHAGNHTEVFKHAVLASLVLEFRKKSKPFTVLDTHAGAGVYDLLGPEALKTGEAQHGIGRVFESDIPAASAYLNVVRGLNSGELRYYPGSPAIVRSLLREEDRLIACEFREDDAAALRLNFKGDRRVSVHRRDGYEAMVAVVPPSNRRGLVFIDPPFEDINERDRLGRGLESSVRKWPTGTYAVWYPIKDRLARDAMTKHLAAAQLPRRLMVEFLLFPEDGIRLAGSGIVVCNPPWRFDEILGRLCADLLKAFDVPSGRYSIEWLSDEWATD